jgi:hypothetical protein
MNRTLTVVGSDVKYSFNTMTGYGMDSVFDFRQGMEFPMFLRL